MMQKLKLVGLVAGMTMAGALVASAAPVTTVTEYTSAAYDAFKDSLISSTVEDFEGLGASLGFGATGSPLSTAVGDIATIPGRTGTGTCSTGGGLTTALISGTWCGRTNTTVGGEWWLDSNDTIGMLWDVALGDGGLFDSIGFTLSDPADQGAELTIKVGDEVVKTLVGAVNGTISLVVVRFSEKVSSVQISLANVGRNIPNDGFGIDDLTVGAVPLPAGAVLMLSGLGLFAAARRRKAA